MWAQCGSTISTRPTRPVPVVDNAYPYQYAPYATHAKDLYLSLYWDGWHPQSLIFRQEVKHGLYIGTKISDLQWPWTAYGPLYCIMVVVVSALASINEVNLRRAQLVLRWATVSGFNSRCWTLISVCNQPAKANSAFRPSGVGKWVPASAGKAKTGMVHSVSGFTRGVQVKLWDPLTTCAIRERIRGVITTSRYTNPRLPYLILPNSSAAYYTLM